MFPIARFLAALTAALALVAGLGCGSDAAVQVPATPTQAAAATPVLVLDKLDVDIGTLAADLQTTETFLIGNLGGQDLHFRVVDLQVVEGCDAVRVDTATTTVPSQQVVQLPVVTGPHRDLGAHRYNLTLESNDPTRARRTLSVRFSVAERPVSKVAGPDLVVDKSVINTGEVPYDWPMYERFTLRNAGDRPLVLAGTPVLRVEEGC